MGVMKAHVCACGCGEPIPDAVLAWARMLGNEHIVRYASPTHRERARKRRMRAKQG